MPIELRQASGQTVAAGQSVSCPVTLTAASRATSLLLLVAAATHPRENLNAFPTNPDGFTRILTRKEDKLTVAVWQRTAAPATSRVTVPTGGQTYGTQARLHELVGAAQASAIDRTAVGGANPERGPGSTTPASGSTAALSRSGQLAIGLVVNRYASTTQAGFVGGFTRLSESLSFSGEPDHDRTRMTVHAAQLTSTNPVALGARLSANRDWVAAVVTVLDGALGPVRISSRNQPPALRTSGRGQIGLMGPLRSRNQPPALRTSGHGWIGPSRHQYLIGGRSGLLIGTGTPYRIESISGLNGWDVQHGDTDLSIDDGAERGLDRQAARQVVMSINFDGRNEPLEVLAQRLLAALRPRRDEDFDLLWRPVGMELQMLRCRPGSLTREITAEQLIRTKQPILLRAADPRIYSAAEHRVQVPVTPARSDDTVNLTSVSNAGNAEAYPVITVTAPPGLSVTGVELVNASNDTRFEASALLADGSVLVGDMPAVVTRNGRSKITINGQARYSSWTYPREPLVLAPGINALYLRTTPAGVPVVAALTYRDTSAG